MMKRLPRKLWHTVHLLSIPMFVLATVHGFTSGADNKNLAIQWVALTGGLLVFLLVTFRVLAPRRSNRSVERGAPRGHAGSRTAGAGASEPERRGVHRTGDGNRPALTPSPRLRHSTAAVGRDQPNAATETIGTDGG